MIGQIGLAGLVVLIAFVFGYFYPRASAAVIFGLASSIAWAMGSTSRAPRGLNSYMNIFAAAFAAAAVGFAAPHG